MMVNRKGEGVIFIFDSLFVLRYDSEVTIIKGTDFHYNILLLFDFKLSQIETNAILVKLF